MPTIPVISSSPELVARMELCRASHGLSRPLVRVVDRPIDLLQTELPDLFVIDLSDPVIDVTEVLETVRNDPWLFGGGILALSDDANEEEDDERSQGGSFVALVLKERLEQDLPRILRIIEENPRLLFQRVVGPELVPELSGSFVLDNDPIVARCYESLICNFLYNANRVDADTRDALSFSMNELLLNAIEHGNCGISYEEKGAWLEEGKRIQDLIDERTKDPLVAKRRVTLEYDITPTRSRFRIADEGEGFDWRQSAEIPTGEALFRAHGRGLLMTRTVTETLSFNERGNEVSFDVLHQQDVASATPGLLEGLPATKVAAGQVLFEQGDMGEELYFITRGRYDVVADGKLIAELGPDDLILGEMSWLLRSPRNATVRARTSGSVVAISNARFVEAVRGKPYYALLLARLLAERLQRMVRQGVRELK